MQEPTKKRITENLEKLQALVGMLHKVRPLKLEAAAEYLGISKSHLYKLTSEKKIKFHKPNGKVVYFFEDELDEWVRGNDPDGVAVHSMGQDGGTDKDKITHPFNSPPKRGKEKPKGQGGVN